MSADERLAIWRYATPEERQRVIDGEWDDNDGLTDNDTVVLNGHACCPWGAAFGGYDHPRDCEFVGWPLGSTVASRLSAREGDRLPYETAFDLASAFMDIWDSSSVGRDDLIAYLRRLNAEEATQ